MHGADCISAGNLLMLPCLEACLRRILRMHPGIAPHLHTDACRSWTRMALTPLGRATCPSCPTWRPA